MDNAPAITTLTAVDAFYRLLNNVRARIRAINFQADVQSGHNAQSVSDIEDLRRVEACLLDIQYTTPNSWRFRVLSRWFRKYGSTDEHVRRLFGDHKKVRGDRGQSEGEVRLLKALARANADNRVRFLVSRIKLEILQRNHEGWYIIMNNLTVANEYYEKVFYSNERVFEKYITRFKRYVRIACDGKEGFKKGDAYHSYFAVVEAGGERGRLHFHCVHFCRQLPKGIIDPNIGRKIPDRRICDELRCLWPYGYSAPIAVRFSGMDNYARLGWRWPVEYKNGKPVAIKASTGDALAHYVGDYITKAQHIRGWKWKTRMSQGFGIFLIRKSMKNMSDETLMDHLITVSAPQHVTIKNLMLPMMEVRKEAVREFLLRLNSGKLNSKTLTIQRFLILLKQAPSIVEQYRILIQRKQSPRLPSTGITLTKNSNGTAIFEARCVFEETLGEYGFMKRELAGRGDTRYGV